MVEQCYRTKTRTFVHPIIDWNTHEVWTFIRENNIPYCKLYDEGFKRLGCVLCPMTRDVKRQMERWPAIARAWERAVKATFQPPSKKFLAFKTPEEYWQWWLNRDASTFKKDDDQMMMFED